MNAAVASVGVATASGTKIVVRLPPRLIRPSENDLEFRRQWIKMYGALLHPKQEMQGIGHYEFLTVYHEAVARFVGLSTPKRFWTHASKSVSNGAEIQRLSGIQRRPTSTLPAGRPNLDTGSTIPSTTSWKPT